MTDGVEPLVEFARALREAGVRGGPGSTADFCRAAALLEPEGLYWAGRLTLVGRREELPVYDRVFEEFFGRRPPLPPPKAREPERRPPVAVPAEDEEPEDADLEPPLALASRVEILRHKSFDRCTPAELAEIAALAEVFARALPRRRSRRQRGASSGSLDLPRTLRRALRTGGEPFERRYRTHRQSPRRLVLLLDVSGSMAASSRGLLGLAWALRRVRPATDVYCFGTRLTSVGRALAAPSLDGALAAVAAAVADWEGGTRIGETLKEFLAREGHRGGARGAIVVICSDGLDVGAPELLGEQMARLARLAHRVVWLNPLKRDPAYEPLARGMAAALPSVDVFASGHDLASVEAAALALTATRTPSRFAIAGTR